MKQSWIIFGVALAIIGLALLLWFSLFERVEVDKNTGFSEEARSKPFLAAERMLNKLNIPTIVYNSLSSNYELPPEDGALLITSSRKTMSDARANELLDWVDNGGSLYLIAHNIGSPVPDPLLDDFGIYAYLPEMEPEDEEEQQTPEEEPEEAAGEETQEDVEPFHSKIDLDGKTYKVDLGYKMLGWSLEPGGFNSAYNSAAVDMLSYPSGEGRIVVFTTADFMTNWNIRELDHASFIFNLFQMNDRVPSEIRIIYGESYPTIWEYLYEKAWAIMPGLALFLIVLIWALAPRHGPMEPDLPEARRRLMEHVEASGKFLWRLEKGKSLLDASRNAFRDRLRKCRPIWTRLSHEDLCHQLSDLCGLEPAPINEALVSTTPTNEAHFHQLIKSLEIMRRAL